MEVVEKIKTHFMFYNFFFRESRAFFWDNMEKYGRSGQATDDNIMYSSAKNVSTDFQGLLHVCRS